MDRFLHPETALNELSIHGNMHIADLGSGAGHFSLAAARMLAQGGKVHAFDVQKEPLESLRTDAARFGLHNITTQHADLELPGGTRLADGSMDVVFLHNILFQAEDKPAMIKEAARILHPNGKLSVIDWVLASAAGAGPAHEQRISKEMVKELAKVAGLSYEKDFRAGSQHYGMIFKKL